MPEGGFSIFWIFFIFFPEFSSPGQLWTEFWTKIFFFSFSSYHISYWLKIMPQGGFLIFWFFFYFFWNFLAQVEYERNLGQKFYSLFLGLFQLVLAKNNARKRFSNFLIFVSISFGIFLQGSIMNGIRA